MSELSVRQYLHNDGYGLTLGYDKSEADAVIAELKETLKNSRNARKYWRTEYLIEYKECLHQKYKRCLAMALVWLERSENSTDLENELVSRKRCCKWMELAEKFKEEK